MYGHHEWVTCVDYLLDGRIISGGMDSKLCLWDKRIVKCTDLHGHSASISCVKSSDDCKYAISGSYDRSLMIWNLKDGRPSTQMKGVQDCTCLTGQVTKMLLWILRGMEAQCYQGTEQEELVFGFDELDDNLIFVRM